MIISEAKFGTATVLYPDGRLDQDSAETFQEHLLQAVSGGSEAVIVDFSKIPYISSVGLRALAAAQVRSKAEGGDLKIAGLNERVARVFRIIGFDILLSIHDTPEAAIADFSSSAAS